MSSGTRPEVGRVRRMLGGLVEKLAGSGQLGTPQSQALINRRIARLGLSPRQQDLNWLWAWYRTQHYDSRKIDWNGKQVTDPIEHEGIATQGYVPPGFQSVGTEFPIKFRKPTSPYALPKVVVDRFTSLLFSEARHPDVVVEGDADTEDFASALCEEARLWQAFILARTYGGAMGSVAVGFQFVNGKPVVEVHDPRWCFPTFTDRHSLKLKSIEKRYIFSEEKEDPFTGAKKPVDFWYRRVIDEQKDVLYAPVEVGEGEEPQWQVEKEVVHGLGFCPVRWLQNLPVQDDIDGDPDCVGIYEVVETIDALIAQATRGILANCDPTVVLTTKAPMAEVQKGSDNAIKVPDGDAKYMEMNGSGLTVAMAQAETLRRYALEVVQCVLEHPDTAQRTATEVEKSYSSMFSKADVMREQYGEKGVKPLLEDMIAAARKLGAGSPDEAGQVVKQVLTLPPRIVKVEGGEPTQKERVLGPGGHVKLNWHPYFDPSLDDVAKATDAAGKALQGALIDAEHASKFVANYYGVEDVQAMLAKVKKEEAERDREAREAMMAQMGGPQF